MCKCTVDERREEVKENIKFLTESYKSKKWEGLLMTFAVLEICQLNEDISFSDAKEMMYRYLEDVVNPEL
jgi:hypothetical protein